MAVAWFEQTPMGRNVIRVSQPHVGELLAANLWWLRGTDRDIVVDAGLGVVDLRAHIPLMFDRDPLVVLTHSHLDHVGGAHAFRERAAHKDEAAILAEGVPASLYGPELYEKLGLEADGEPIPQLLIDDMPHPGYDPSAYRVDPVTLTRQLDDGDRIDLGGRALTVLHLPGHTPGSIALLEEHSGVLFSGDVVYDGHLIDDLPESDVPSYRHSLERLLDVDVSVVHPGHWASFDQTRLHVLIDTYLRTSPA
jgi:glyoxylase-like metal-dependent hydrolase (beta-lactamase superfamily II)